MLHRPPFDDHEQPPCLPQRFAGSWLERVEATRLRIAAREEGTGSQAETRGAAVGSRSMIRKPPGPTCRRRQVCVRRNRSMCGQRTAFCRKRLVLFAIRVQGAAAESAAGRYTNKHHVSIPRGNNKTEHLNRRAAVVDVI